LIALPPSDVSLPAPAQPAPKLARKAAVSINDLFERYAKAGSANFRTISKWRPQVDSFVDHLGHDDATRVTRGDLTRWVESLVARGLAKCTISDSYVAAVKVTLQVAYDDELIPANPASGLKVRAPKPTVTQNRDHSTEAAETILKPTFAEFHGAVSITSEIDGIGDVVSNYTSESELDDHASVLRRLAPRAGVSEYSLQRALETVDERIEEVQFAQAKAIDPEVPTTEAVTDEAFGNDALHSLFESLR
jgi:hypothetical protein